MMVRSKMINKRRWLIVLFLTKRYGKMPATIDVPVARILVIRPNHRLGNQLLLTPLLQEIEKLYPAAKY
jgi:heptosyltransferase-3